MVVERQYSYCCQRYFQMMMSVTDGDDDDETRQPGHDEHEHKEDEQEDSVYQRAEVARLSAEMPRADVSGEDWGAFDVETLRIAGLCRTVLIRLNYCHVCTPLYCLKGAANTLSSV